MLSDFETPKPNKEFNQIYLDNLEVLIETIPVIYRIDNENSLRGKLHLTSRSLVFQPNDENI